MKLDECYICKDMVEDIGGFGNKGRVCIPCSIKIIEDNGGDPYRLFPKETVDRYRRDGSND